MVAELYGRSRKRIEVFLRVLFGVGVELAFVERTLSRCIADCVVAGGIPSTKLIAETESETVNAQNQCRPADATDALVGGTS